jgi:hypothetical protein
MRINEVFTIKPSLIEEQKTALYCLIGNEDFIDDNGNPRISSEDNPKIMAKAIPNKPSKHMGTADKMQLRFYIRTKQNDIIYNPVTIASSVKDKEAFDFINNTCKGGVSFKEVPQSVFDKYISFLKTKNIRWLNAAQRELK